jgi:hypothetical protein
LFFNDLYVRLTDGLLLLMFSRGAASAHAYCSPMPHVWWLLQGRVVSFKNAIIIMTSNLGSAEIFKHAFKAQQHQAASSEAGACSQIVGFRCG